MKFFLKLLVLIIILILTIIYRENISNFIINIIFPKEIHIQEPNDYAINYKIKYVEQVNDFYAKNSEQLLNIVYTLLNNGHDNFYFYCEYEECENDINKFTEDGTFLNINSFVHPYNSYQKLFFNTNSLGKVTINVDKVYNENNINEINNKIDKIMQDILKDNMDIKEKITLFHKYIIDITTYDNAYFEQNLDDIYNPSHSAIGPLFNGKALCGGYTDAMAIFLNKLKIPNYRISSETHIWNLVKLDNKCYHLDLTWDEPVNDFYHNTFLLITIEELEQLDTYHHNFDKNIFSEAS